MMVEMEISDLVLNLYFHGDMIEIDVVDTAVVDLLRVVIGAPVVDVVDDVVVHMNESYQ